MKPFFVILLLFSIIAASSYGIYRVWPKKQVVVVRKLKDGWHIFPEDQLAFSIKPTDTIQLWVIGNDISVLKNDEQIPVIVNPWEESESFTVLPKL